VRGAWDAVRGRGCLGTRLLGGQVGVDGITSSSQRRAPREGKGRGREDTSLAGLDQVSAVRAPGAGAGCLGRRAHPHAEDEERKWGDHLAGLDQVSAVRAQAMRWGRLGAGRLGRCTGWVPGTGCLGGVPETPRGGAMGAPGDGVPGVRV
jgi:hypothetical protein